MENIEVTSISSRGQVVIPQNLRDKLKIREGEKFVVIGEDNTIILRKLEMPSFKGFDKLLAKTREFAKKNELKEINVEQAVRNARKK
ncbi:MAG: AbrB/MazE/SpoVT family DNA-binding domain-containing protein [Nanoarchaeota archaeon]